MKRPSKEIKRIARDILNQRYRIPMVLFVITTVVPALLELPFTPSISESISPLQLVVFLLAEYLIMLITQVLGVGAVYIHLNMTRCREFRLGQILYPFRNGTDRFFAGSFFLSLITLACSLPALGSVLYFYFTDITALSVGMLIVCCLLSLILYVVYSLRYNFVLYFILDYPEMPVRQAFKEARQMMRGNMGRLLYIQCSYLGWGLLSLLSLGIGSLWIEPYFRQIMVIFYLDCTMELDSIPVRDYGTPYTGDYGPIL